MFMTDPVMFMIATVMFMTDPVMFMTAPVMFMIDPVMFMTDPVMFMIAPVIYLIAPVRGLIQPIIIIYTDFWTLSFFKYFYILIKQNPSLCIKLINYAKYDCFNIYHTPIY